MSVGSSVDLVILNSSDEAMDTESETHRNEQDPLEEKEGENEEAKEGENETEKENPCKTVIETVAAFSFFLLLHSKMMSASHHTKPLHFLEEVLL